MEVGEAGRVGTDDLDLAERGAVEQRDRIGRRAASRWMARSGSSGPYEAAAASAVSRTARRRPGLGFEREALKRIDAARSAAFRR